MNKSAQKLKALIAQTAPEVIALRRAIHKYPELSGRERKTAELVRGTLSGWGIPARYHLDKTAVSARIAGGKGPTVVLRADMDALPIQEENDVPYASVNPGVMHACGHDMHTAILLGAAKIISQIRERLNGTVLCLFQPSEEEEPGGAQGLIRAGVFPPEAVAVFGLHVSADHPSGHIAIREGSDYAGVLNFDIAVRGRGGHGATPEKAVDPILCAAHIVTQLQALISREKPSAAPAVLSVGSFHSGTGRNIIPDAAVLRGTVRAYSDELLKFFTKRIREAATATASAFGASAEVVFEKSYPPGYNDPELAGRFRGRVREFLGEGCVADREFPTMYAEDFSRYQQLAPGLFVYLGVVPRGRKRMEEIHSPRFLPDENAVEAGMAAHALFAIELLGGNF
ncbi:MAG: amidohydrolase [Chitinispirillales bacterium]|jgi:amidohydrolase|nr:amidohydrolase [Chitinispirillales bacterium]